MIPTIIKYRKVIAGGALLILLVIGYIYWASYQQGVGEARATHKYNALIDKQKREAAELLARETAKVDKAKKELHDEKNEREFKMRETRNTWLTLVLGCVTLLLTAGCATPMQDVGRVVIPPSMEVPPVPVIVQITEPKPQGYFQQSLLDYFNSSPAKPTK